MPREYWIKIEELHEQASDCLCRKLQGKVSDEALDLAVRFLLMHYNEMHKIMKNQEGEE